MFTKKAYKLSAQLIEKLLQKHCIISKTYISVLCNWIKTCL